MVEMISPVNQTFEYAKDNKNGFMSSIIAWLKGSNETTGHRNVTAFTIYDPGYLPSNLPSTCIVALSATVKCDAYLQIFQQPAYHGSLDDETLTGLICDTECDQSLQDWFNNVQRGIDCLALNLRLLGGLYGLDTMRHIKVIPRLGFIAMVSFSENDS